MSDPVVTLAGKEYPVPPLVPKQQRIVIPTLMKIAAALRASGGGFNAESLTTELYDDMLNCVFWGAIWPQDKSAKREIVDELPISFADLMVAINIIREQTGLFRPAPEGATAGESMQANGG